MLNDYPKRMVIDKIGKIEFMLAIEMRHEDNEIINTLTDDEILGMIEKETGVKLEKPNREIEVKLKKYDVAFIVQKENNEYVFYEIIV